MKDDRLRVSIDDAYLHALGLAVFCFARLEWDAIWCCEKMKPGYIVKLGRRTAGNIAADLVRLSAQHPVPSTAKQLEPAAVEFERLVNERNALVHAKPGSAPNCDQRLFVKNSEWTVAMVHALADEFVEAQMVLNDHLHVTL